MSIEFDARTASPEEFEAEARKHHAMRLTRIQAMTPEEMQACAKFMLDGYLQRAATLRLNEIFPVQDLDTQIAKCVEIWRTDNHQSSAEYEAERDRLVEADRARKLAEREEAARIEAAERNARQRWLDQGNDPVAMLGRGDEELPAGAREPETAATFEDWLRLGRPDVLAAPGRLPTRFAYPDGATDEEAWDFYWTKRDFLQSGLSWNSEMGRRLGNEHLAVERRIKAAVADRQSVADRRSAEAAINDEYGDEVADAELIEDIEGAIEFHRTKTRLQRNIDQWTHIRDAIVNGSAPPALVARVERAASGAKPGNKFYALWMAVRDRVRTLSVQ